MKKWNVKVAVFIVVCVLAVVVAGCGGPKVSPEESAKIFGEMAGRFDFTNADKIKMPKQEQEKTKKAAKDAAKGMVQMLFTSFKIPMTDEQVNRILEAQFEMQKKVEIQTELISKADKESMVKISVSSIDMKKFEKTIEASVMKNAEGMDERQFKAKGGEIITAALIEGYNTAEFLPEKSAFETKCIIDEKLNIWRPEDEVNFALNVTRRIVGQQGVPGK